MSDPMATPSTDPARPWPESESGIDNGICMECDLPVRWDLTLYDVGNDSDKECVRTKPFCLNHANKVDWRERAKRAEAFIATSETCARAEDVAWVYEENQRMRAEFKRFVEACGANKALDFNMSACEWCGDIWPKTEGSTLAQIKQRARRHLMTCKKHPLKGTIDDLSQTIADLRKYIAEGAPK